MNTIYTEVVKIVQLFVFLIFYHNADLKICKQKRNIVQIYVKIKINQIIFIILLTAIKFANLNKLMKNYILEIMRNVNNILKFIYSTLILTNTNIYIYNHDKVNLS